MPAAPVPPQSPASIELQARLIEEIEAAGGWLGFERYMELALYAPGLGYYSRGDRQFGQLARDGSDFVTAPELSPYFARALARQLAQVLEATGTREVFEFGAGSGALAAGLLQALGDRIDRYTIVDLSGALQARQRATVAERAPQSAAKLGFAAEWPTAMRGVVVGNELLDAMPAVLLHFDGAQWLERGVARSGSGFAWADRPTTLRPPEDTDFLPGTTTELPRQAAAFMRTLAERLQLGAAFFLDYGFPQAEYYHPQRLGGTLACHRAHLVDFDPLQDPGDKDITTHVDFTAAALAAQDAGLDVLGYTTQARFLMNCGLLGDLQDASWAEKAAAQKLLTEHEMGELFKVLAVGRGVDVEPLGFLAGDRMHTL